jgi:hypothetical protein
MQAGVNSAIGGRHNINNNGIAMAAVIHIWKYCYFHMMNAFFWWTGNVCNSLLYKAVTNVGSQELEKDF